MKPFTKMMLLNGGRKDREDRWEPEDKFRDRRGREHYDNGRFAPRNDGGTWVEDRFRDGRGRERYDDGRYAPRGDWTEPQDRGYRRYEDGRFAPRSDGGPRMGGWDNGGVRDYGVGMGYPYPYPHVPPMYRREDYPEFQRKEYGGMDTGRPMNKIGFYIDGTMDSKPPREFQRDFREDEMSYRRGERVGGYGDSSVGAPLDRRTAEEWVDGMENTDPRHPRGGKWSWDQAKALMKAQGFHFPEAEWYAALNMIWSDYGQTLSQYGVSSEEVFAKLAKDWLDDQDVEGDKTAKYYWAVVK